MDKSVTQLFHEALAGGGDVELKLHTPTERITRARAKENPEAVDGGDEAAPGSSKQKKLEKKRKVGGAASKGRK